MAISIVFQATAHSVGIGRSRVTCK